MKSLVYFFIEEKLTVSEIKLVSLIFNWKQRKLLKIITFQIAWTKLIQQECQTAVAIGPKFGNLGKIGPRPAPELPQILPETSSLLSSTAQYPKI